MPEEKGVRSSLWRSRGECGGVELHDCWPIACLLILMLPDCCERGWAFHQQNPVISSPPFQSCAALCLPFWPLSMALGQRGAAAGTAAGETGHMRFMVRSRSARSRRCPFSAQHFD